MAKVGSQVPKNPVNKSFLIIQCNSVKIRGEVLKKLACKIQVLKDKAL
jgi:hypothetical protein